MDKELEKKFAALADDMLKDFREMPLENMEEVLDFNEDEESIFSQEFSGEWRSALSFPIKRNYML